MEILNFRLNYLCETKSTYLIFRKGEKYNFYVINEIVYILNTDMVLYEFKMEIFEREFGVIV